MPKAMSKELAFYLYSLIFLVGYIIISAVILVIRSTIPYVGSGTDNLTIILTAVLMPLALGNYAGGKFKNRLSEEGAETPRRKLLQNFMISAILLTIGLSFVTIEIFFKSFFSITDRHVAITIFSTVFIALPLYSLGQTIPLASSYLPKSRLPKLTGKILFYFTFGLLAGAVLIYLVFMPTIGVHYTVSITITCITIITILTADKLFRQEVIITCLCLAISLSTNTNSFLKKWDILSNNNYNLISIKRTEAGDYGNTQAGKMLILNNNISSFIGEEDEILKYTKFAEDVALRPIALQNQRPNAKTSNILVIGAGGFSFGVNDTFNKYDYVDNDGAIKEIAEKYFLKEKLTENKEFHDTPIRAFLSSTDKKYDVVFLDTYTGATTIPEHLVTREYFNQIKNSMTENGIMVANMVTNPNFRNRYSIRLDNTLRSVFPYCNRQVISGYNGWYGSPEYKANIIYICYPAFKEYDDTVYTDNINTAFIDKNKSPEETDEGVPETLTITATPNPSTEEHQKGGPVPTTPEQLERIERLENLVDTESENAGSSDLEKIMGVYVDSNTD